MMTPEIMPSARKHGIEDADILHALAHVTRFREQEYDGERRMLYVGGDRTGRLLELIVVPVDDPQRIIHADRLRPSLYDIL